MILRPSHINKKTREFSFEGLKLRFFYDLSTTRSLPKTHVHINFRIHTNSIERLHPFMSSQSGCFLFLLKDNAKQVIRDYKAMHKLT